MRQRDLHAIRTELVRRRRTLLETERRATKAVEDQRSRDRAPETEEAAQVDQATDTLTWLTESQRREVAAIDAATARMDAGAYGVCVDCYETISVERLKVLPFASRCAPCATAFERRGLPGAPLSPADPLGEHS